MNDEDFVETSDPEEREELLQARSPLYTELVVLPSGPGVVRDPRKRRKLYHHEFSTPSPNTLSSNRKLTSTLGDGLHDDDNSLTPTSTVMNQRTSSTVAPMEYIDQTPIVDVNNGSPCHSDLLQEEPNVPVLLDDIFPLEGSQDELDVMFHHEESSPVQNGNNSMDEVLPNIHAFSKKQIPSLPDPSTVQIQEAGASQGAENPASSLPLPFSSVKSQVQPTPKSLHRPDMNNVSQLSPLSPLSSSSQTPVIHHPTRSSSLPPSSPLHVLPSEIEDHPRTGSLSPVYLSQHHRNEDNGNPSILQAETSRRYSMRTRRPQQLNPYEYDKRLYKLQLRHNPDALVKVISPRREHTERRHKSHEPEGDDEFVVDEGDNESQEHLAIEKQRNRQSTSRVDSNLPPGYPDIFYFSDDELPPLDSPTEGDKVTGAKTFKERRRLAPFPLRMSRPLDTSLEPHSVGKKGSSAISYIRRKDVPKPRANISKTSIDTAVNRSPGRLHQSLSYRHRESSSLCNVASYLPQSRSPRGSDFQIPDGEQFHDTKSPDIDTTPLDALDGDDFHGDFYTVNQSDFEQDQEKVTSSKESHRVADTFEVSSTQPSEAEESEGSEDSGESAWQINRKRSKDLKILGRMMPKVMITKMFQTQSAKKKANRIRSKSVSSIGHDSSDDGDLPLVPGKSRVTKRSSKAHYVVTGDTQSSESESDKQHPDSPSSLSSSASSDFSEDEALGPGRDQFHAESQAGWFDDDFSAHCTNMALSRKKEDLIDRMLSRTRSSNPKKTKRHKSARHRKAITQTAQGKNPILDIVIPNAPGTRKKRQTRLPFAIDASTHPSDSADPIVSPHMQEMQHNDHGQQKRLKTKQRREAKLSKQLFTIKSGADRIMSGRKKGLIHIDMRDSSFHQALAPLQTKNSSYASRPSAASIPEARMKYTFDQDQDKPLRQTSLYDFSRRNEDGPQVHDSAFDELCAHDDYVQSGDADLQRSYAKLSIDFGIAFVPLGVSFESSSYLGKHLLYELLQFISGHVEIHQPEYYADLDIIIDSGMNDTQFSEVLEGVCDLLCKWCNSISSDKRSEEMHSSLRRHERLMSSTIAYAMWLISKADEPGRGLLLSSISYCFRRLTSCVGAQLKESKSMSNGTIAMLLTVAWFTIEFSTRLLVLSQRLGIEISDDNWKDAILLLLRWLLAFGFEDILKLIHDSTGVLNGDTITIRAAELWICLIHLLPRFSEASTKPVIEARQDQDFWSLIKQIIQEEKPRLESDLKLSEYYWRLIFSLCALSQFSVHGISTSNVSLPISWETIGEALDSIRLTHESSIDQSFSSVSLRKRDDYVRMVLSRCYLLCTRWRWSLREASVMFNKVVNIFKSRKFANLLGEGSDFPAFLRHCNLQMLQVARPSDTAFSLFLKLVVRAAKEDEDAQDSAQRANTRLKKLLSLTVPTSGVPFTNSAPPIGQELSMLYNRFSSNIIAIYLEPNDNNVRYRMNQARRYVNFSMADWKSQQACIRALMHTSILIQHFHLSLAEPLRWLEEMTEALMSEYNDAERSANATNLRQSMSFDAEQRKKRVIITTQLLLGCVRKIIETPSMSNESDTPPYPDIGLLDGPWVKDIFAKREFTNIVTTRLEILKLVQSFLYLRLKILPPSSLRTPASIPQVESQESQDEFMQFELDINDPDLLAALDMNVHDTANSDIKLKDKKAAEIMDNCITPAIYRLLLQQFKDTPSSNNEKIEVYWTDADKWVDCWVGCAAIVVQNGLRKWEHYFNLGPQSWDRISDSFLRRRIGLRFMYQLLSLDPSSYKDYQDSFIGILFESLVSYKINIEHDFMSLLFSVDRLQHSIFRGLPVPKEVGEDDFHFTKAQYIEQRLGILDKLFSNLNEHLIRAAAGERNLDYINARCIGFLKNMLGNMEDIFNNITAEEDGKQYLNFCLHVFSTFALYPELQSQPLLASHMAWGKTLDAAHS